MKAWRAAAVEVVDGLVDLLAIIGFVVMLATLAGIFSGSI